MIFIAHLFMRMMGNAIKISGGEHFKLPDGYRSHGSMTEWVLGGS